MQPALPEDAYDDDAGALDWLVSWRTARRLGARAAIGALPGLAAAASSARMEVVVLVIGVGLIPLLLAPIALWAEAREQSAETCRRARRLTHVAAMLLALMVPVQAVYTAAALAGGPGAGLDAVELRLRTVRPAVLACQLMAAIAIGAALGGLAEERVLRRAPRGRAGGAPRRELDNASLGRAVRWSLWLALPVAAAAVAPELAATRSGGRAFGFVLLGGVGMFGVAFLLAIIAGLASRVVVEVDELADRIALGKPDARRREAPPMTTTSSPAESPPPA